MPSRRSCSERSDATRGRKRNVHREIVNGRTQPFFERYARAPAQY